MSKKVAFGGKPSTKPTTPDDWVESRKIEATIKAEEMKRLTFDISDSLHRRIKSQCAVKGSKWPTSCGGFWKSTFRAEGLSSRNYGKP